MNRTFSIARALAPALLSLAAQQALSAVVIDQRNDSLAPSQGFSTPQRIGQSFVPAAATLAAVELQINDQNLGDGNGFGAFVQVHHGGIDGPVIGTSDTVLFPDSPVAASSPIFPALFSFASLLALIPGDSYVIEVLPAASNRGSIGVFVTGFNHDGYAAGSAIADVLTVDIAPTDLWFRTYTQAVPEPAGLALVLAGLAAAGAVRRHRAVAAG